jgi:diacylglycerol kinase (ATP)
MSGRRHFFIIINSLSLSGKEYLKSVRKELDRISASYDIYETSVTENAEKIAASYLSDQFTDILIIGGDGTINEVINGLPNFNRPIGIIPAGTGNDFYRMISRDDPIKNALFGEIRDYDIGLCNTRRFLNGVGCAIEGETAELFEKKRGNQRNQSKYFLPILKKVITYKSKSMHLIIDQAREYKQNFFLLTIGNGRYFGNGYQLTPKARIDDSQFDIVFTDKVNPLLALIVLAFLPKGWHRFFSFVKFTLGHEIIIKSESSLTVHIDGEIHRSSELLITLLKEKCKIRAG